MPKVFWAALPLLIAGAVLILLVLRRRTPSRLALNVMSSVLLLAYLATTAGLGIFWVANQQLPVFDWHYLFGYGTVLLVLLHVFFNFPVVWRFFSRRPRATAPGHRIGSRDPAPAMRRGLVGALALAAASGAGFLIGWRQGRGDVAATNRSFSPQSTDLGSAPADAARERVERFHALSSHSRSGVLMHAPSVDWGGTPPPFKRYRDSPRVSLPGRGERRDAGFGLAALADVLWHGTGITAERAGLKLRAAPSSGALFATELYLAVRQLPDLPAGWWHYEPEAHTLERLGEASGEALLRAASPAFWGDAPVWIAATAIFRRSGYKYRDRTYRYIVADLGHALENLRVAAGACGARLHFAAAFDNAVLARALDLDDGEEGVLAWMALVPGPAAATPVSAGAEPSASAAVAPGHWRPAPTRSSSESPLGVTAAIHAESSLRAASAPIGRSTALGPAPVARSVPHRAIELPPAVAPSVDWLRVIAERRSVRRFASTPLPMPALAGVLSHMTRPAPALSSAVRIDVVIHAVAGLPPGAYRYLPERHALVPRAVPSSLRERARAAALDQDVIGDAAVVFVLSIERAAFAADPLGVARGYRHAYLEAGMVGERVYLEAAARGLAACAVGAFYDAEAAALVGVDPTDEWVVHFAALGVAA